MKVILLTGVSGVLGSSVLEHGIKNKNYRFLVLLRASKQASAQERWQTLKSFLELTEEESARVHVINADLFDTPWKDVKEKMDDLGISHLNGIIHSAGDVNMSKPLDKAISESSLLTDAIFRIAELSDTRPKIEFISTVGVAGHMRGDVPEQWIEHDRCFRNTYEESKAEIEIQLKNKIESGWAITVHRPSMIVGHSQTGKNISFQIFYYLCEFLSGHYIKGFIPDLSGFHLDTVPVDYVAKTILWSFSSENAVGKIFHQSSGDQSLSLDQVAKISFEAFQSAGKSVNQQKVIPLPLFKLLTYLAKVISNPRTKRRISTLNYFFGLSRRSTMLYKYPNTQIFIRFWYHSSKTKILSR